MGEKPFGPRSTLGDAANAEPAAYLTRMEYSRSDHISCGTLRPRPVRSVRSGQRIADRCRPPR